jgi:hypothetical protein
MVRFYAFRSPQCQCTHRKRKLRCTIRFLARSRCACSRLQLEPCGSHITNEFRTTICNRSFRRSRT